MSGVILPIILGVIMVLGLIFPGKMKPDDESQNPLKPFIRRGLKVASVVLRIGIPVFLVSWGIHYYYQYKKEQTLQAELQKKELERQIRFKQLFEIINTPPHEREMKILELDFDLKEPNEFGKVYERDYGNEKIEVFGHNGTIRYLSKSKDSYLRIFKEAKDDSCIFTKTSSNNMGDNFSDYTKGGYAVSFGFFTGVQAYAAIITDVSKIGPVEPFIPVEFLAGSWGRVSSLNSGKYLFKTDGSFLFEDSYYGPITGKWHTDRKTIVLDYNKKIREYGIAHSLSMKTEIIDVTNKLNNKLECFLDKDEYRTVILSRQE